MTPHERLIAAAMILRDAAEALDRLSDSRHTRNPIRSCAVTTTHPPTRPAMRTRKTAVKRRPPEIRAFERRLLSRLNEALARQGVAVAVVAFAIDIPVEVAAARLAGIGSFSAGELIAVAHALDIDPAELFRD